MSRTTSLMLLGLLAVIVGALMISSGAGNTDATGGQDLALLGLVVAIPGAVALQVAIIGKGVKIGMDDHAESQAALRAENDTWGPDQT